MASHHVTLLEQAPCQNPEETFRHSDGGCLHRTMTDDRPGPREFPWTAGHWQGNCRFARSFKPLAKASRAGCPCPTWLPRRSICHEESRHRTFCSALFVLARLSLNVFIELHERIRRSANLPGGHCHRAASGCSTRTRAARRST